MQSNWRAVDIMELWTRRNVVKMLVVRDIKIRYKQSFLGMIWVLVRPIIIMIVFTYLFGEVANLKSSEIPYPIFVFSAMIAWDLFANIVLGCASSITSHKIMVEKLYCPRILFPVSAVFVAIFDFFVALLVLMVLMLIYGVFPVSNVMWFPFLVFYVVLIGLSVGLWLAAIAVWLRDVKFMVTYLIQLMLLLTPVGYGAASVPEDFSFFVTLNPMASIVEAFRWSLLGTSGPDFLAGLVSVGMTTILFVGGILFFNTMEKSFADVI